MCVRTCVEENVLTQPGCVRWEDRSFSPWLFVLWESGPHRYIILLSAYLFTCIIYLRGVCISGSQRASFGSQSLLPQCGLLRSISGCQSWRQVPFPVEPSHLISPPQTLFSFVFRDRFLCSFGACPGTLSVDPPVSASRVLGLKVCATTARLAQTF